MADVALQYDIPKNATKSIAAQITAFSSLMLDQGELGKLQLKILGGSDSVADMGTFLRRTLTLTPTAHPPDLAPDFVAVYGASADPSTWGLKAIFQQRIEQALATTCTVGP